MDVCGVLVHGATRAHEWVSGMCTIATPSMSSVASPPALMRKACSPVSAARCQPLYRIVYAEPTIPTRPSKLASPAPPECATLEEMKRVVECVLQLGHLILGSSPLHHQRR